ncbi:hypothetical protein ACVHNB_32740 [Streptomyces sp. YJ-C3]
MTPALRTARTCTAATAALGLCALQTGAEGQWIALSLSLYGAAFFAWCARRSYDDHNRTLTEHANARRTAAELAAAGRCCRLADHSGGRAHGTDCARPPTGLADLDEATCCLEAFMFRGREHARTCPTRTTRSSAA